MNFKMSDLEKTILFVQRSLFIFQEYEKRNNIEYKFIQYYIVLSNRSQFESKHANS